MLSILIPTYNDEVTALVESVSEQLKTIKFPFEILVADDASNDLAIVEKNRCINKLTNTSYIEQPKNLGRTATRSFLAQKATFDNLLFMDADVLPERETFITDFNLENNNADVIFGGINYERTPPFKDKMLRWKYGKARESKSVLERKKSPYLSVISGCCFIKKNVFLNANLFLENAYGADVLFAASLEKLNATILHINNPVIHIGLENNENFLNKTKKGLNTLAFLAQAQKIPKDYRPIQKASEGLKKYYLKGFFIFILSFFIPFIERNLKSGNPSLFLFDLYRLHYYSSINRKD